MLDLRLAMAVWISSVVGIRSSKCERSSLESLNGRGLGITYVVAGRSSRKRADGAWPNGVSEDEAISRYDQWR